MPTPPEIKYRHLEGRMFLVANFESFKECAFAHFGDNFHAEDWECMTRPKKYPAVVTFWGAACTTHEPDASCTSLTDYIESLKKKVDAISNF